MYTLGIHHKTLKDCLDLGTLYLNYYFLSLNLLETASNNQLTIEELSSDLVSKRVLYKVRHPFFFS